MAVARADASGCVLADGRFAVVGGYADDGEMRKDGEVFAAGRWEPLHADLLSNRSAHALVAVAGGMIAIGGEDEGAVAAELFDEESRRWLALPHRLAVPRDYRAHVVSWPHVAQLHENDGADLQ